MFKIFPTILIILLFQPAVFAADTSIPPMHSIERIPWAVHCAGAMPKLMAISLCVLAALIIISVLYYRKGGGKNE